MIKPDWNIFKAKFSENLQKNFEWFCYLLFCKEFGKTYLSRFKNQSAIETDPINNDGLIIGWQAKFYSNALSNHRGELLDTLKTAKRDYPSITKLIIYTNQEWGQNKGKEPKGKKDIDDRSRNLGVELEWRTASYFESAFVTIESEIIGRHFFTLDKSVFNLIDDLRLHTENILNEIQPYITFRGQNIVIDRSKDLENIKKNSERIIILSGVGGVGKTALIKILYEDIKGKAPFYIFKATEFELRTINDLFVSYTLHDFLKVHQNENEKTIVIDSSEKLLDLKNVDPFKELLSVLIKDKWKIYFTTRDSYLEDLNYQFFEIYNIAPLNINIRNLESKELNRISDQYHFLLPKDENLLGFINNPFYLNEYLKYYADNEQINYVSFKEKLWNRIIKKSKPSREKCFMQIAFKRANDGQFFINPNYESQIFDDLKKDGILGYESPHGYFITHDIYEEWALEKIIEIEYFKKTNNKTFFQNIGTSLSLRRAFRKWVSERLLLGSVEIKNFIEHVIKSEEVEVFWRDVILVSVLLSDYSDTFFDLLKDTLLANNQELLKKLTFMLRIACKEVDDETFRQLGIVNADITTLKYILTKPKGHGWKSLIKFVFENIDSIGINNINFILPIFYDWSNKFKEGETTKYSGLIALQYYRGTISKNIYYSSDYARDQLLHTILYSSSEIKDELEEILNEVIDNKWKYPEDRYYDLSNVILNKLEGVNVSKILPTNVLKLADLFWSFTPPSNELYSHSRLGIEGYFNIEEDLSYFPASSYQTPIYWLLQTSLLDTINFILQFTNRTVESYAKSGFAANEVEEVKVFIEKGKPIKQYISDRLWCTYRGTQVSPYVLESIHMALEKYFLENGKYIESKSLESWLLYLLKHSKSASISAVVASIVLAYPDKTFNIAKILFRTKQFFFYDTHRWVFDRTQKDSLLMLMGFGLPSMNEIHEKERLEACDDVQRLKLELRS